MTDQEKTDFDALMRANLVRVFGERDRDRGRAALNELYAPDATASWSKPRRVVAKIEWHPGELYPESASS